MNSTSFNIDYRINKSDAVSIKRHLLRCDELFNPKLSSYVNIQEYSEKLFKKAINFEAWHNNVLIGLVSVYFNDLNSKVVYISNVSIEADYQKHGIAFFLLSMAAVYGVNLGFVKIKLEVYRDNTKAIILYKKLGFEEENKDGKKITMVKEI